MLPSVVLDPSVFWILDDSDSGDNRQEWLTNCFAWLTSGLAHGLPVLVPFTAVHKIFDLGFLPIESHLRTMFAQHDLSEVINAGEFAAVINRALTNLPDLLDVGWINYALFEDVTVIEDITAEVIPDDLRELSLDSIAFVAANQAVAPPRFIYAFPRAGNEIDGVAVTLRVVAVDPEDESENLGGIVASDVMVANSPRQIASLLDPLAIWQNAQSDREIAIAIAAAVANLPGQIGPPVKFAIGTGFCGSLDANACLNGGSSSLTLSKCAQLIAAAPNLSVEDFRETGSQQSPARTRPRDGARAKRCHLTTGHAGLRLLFWELADGSIELANVGPKNELIILYGDP